VSDGEGGVGDGAGAAPPLHEVEFRLSWGECDPAGIIYYATYLEWAERAHSEWWHLRGRPITMPGEGDGPSFVVRHVACDYLRAPRPMDQIRCGLRCARIGGTSFTMTAGFTMLDSAVTLAELSLTAVFVDGDLGSVPVPDSARLLLSGRAQ
jgi:acyl-CoA thioester hydrolase